MLLSLILLASSTFQSAVALPQNGQLAPVVASAERIYHRDSKGRRIGVLLPSGYRPISCSKTVSNEGVRTSFPTLLLVKADTVRSGTGLCRLPGIRLREMFDAEMAFSIGTKPLLQYRTNSGHLVSVHRIPEGTSLAPAGYLAAWIIPGDEFIVITYPPSQHKTAMALASSIVLGSAR